MAFNAFQPWRMMMKTRLSVCLLALFSMNTYAALPGTVDPVCYSGPDRSVKADGGNYSYSVPITAAECTSQHGEYYVVHILHIDPTTPNWIAEWKYEFADFSDANRAVIAHNDRSGDKLKRATLEIVNY
jgi:hypothetical protein